MSTIYYGLSVVLMETHARVDAYGDKGVLRGVYVGKDLEEFEAAALAKWVDDGEDVVNVNVLDNGDGGDGLHITFTTPRRKNPRDPEGREADLLFACDFTVGQARMLAEALMTAVRLRTAEERADHDDRHVRGGLMSYNCDDVTCLSIDAWMEPADIRRLWREHKDALPEDCFLTDLYDALPDDAGVKGEKFKEAIAELKKHDPKKAVALASPDRDGMIKLTKLNWRGEGSGHSFDILKEKIAPCIHGTIEAVLVWEGGDSTTGLRIAHGEVEEMDVEFKLVPKKAVRR